MNYPKYDPKKLTKAQLIMIIRTIDNHAPRADKSCKYPGITISEAVFRQLIDDNILPHTVSGDKVEFDYS